MAAPLSLNDLLNEKTRLEGVVEEAKSARTQISLLNKLIAFVAQSQGVDVGDLELTENGKRLGRPPKNIQPGIDGLFHCPEPGCDFTSEVIQGISAHRTVHKGTGVARTSRSRRFEPVIPVDGWYHCPEEGCESKFDRPQGLALHRVHKHKEES